jgi:hypothetical protein
MGLGGGSMICPLANAVIMNRSPEDRHQIRHRGETDCLHERCAWWVKSSEFYPRDGGCALFVLAKADQFRG